jgi:hypothetical protein
VTATETISPIDFQASFKSNLALVDRGASIVFASVNDNRAENYEIYKLPLDSVRPFELFSVNSRAIEKEFSH